MSLPELVALALLYAIVVVNTDPLALARRRADR